MGCRHDCIDGQDLVERRKRFGEKGGKRSWIDLRVRRRRAMRTRHLALGDDIQGRIEQRHLAVGGADIHNRNAARLACSHWWPPFLTMLARNAAVAEVLMDRNACGL